MSIYETVADEDPDYPTDEFGRSTGDPDPDPLTCPKCGQPADGSDDATLPAADGFTSEDS